MADLPFGARVETIPVISVTQGVVRLDSQAVDTATLRARLQEHRRLFPVMHLGAVDDG